MKYLVSIARILVGNLFIFSGIVKANDPLGFSYKLEEYFIEFGMNWEWLHDILVPLASLLCIIEIVLGVAVLVGYRMKLVSWSLLLMILFFTILTGASAIFEIVRSCGCFGDAIPLTPWQSFYKDLILLALILIIFFKRNQIKPWQKSSNLLYVFIISTIIMIVMGNLLEWSMVGEVLVFLWIGVIVKWVSPKANIAAATTVLLALLYSLYVTIAAVQFLPFKDFRPYAIGKNIPKQMELPEDAKPSVYKNILTYKNKNTGEVRVMDDQEYNASKIWENKDWEWQSTESELVQKGDEAKITDFSIQTHDDRDITDDVLSEERLLWIVAYDLSASGVNHWKEINLLVENAKQSGIRVMGLSSAGEKQKNEFIEKHQLDFDFNITDGIVLKTIVRSNPGIVYLENGTVKGKWHENQVPDIEEIRN